MAAPETTPPADSDPRPEPRTKASTAGPAAAPAEAGTRAATRSRLVWVLAAALLLSLVMWGSASQRAGRLTERVAVLEADLAAANSRLGAHERHLDEVKRSAAGVSAQVSALEALLEAGPGASSAPTVAETTEPPSE